MRIDPKLRLLRDSSVPQQRAQRHIEQARDEWRKREDVALIFEEIEAFGRSTPLSNCPMLDTLMHEPERAKSIVLTLTDQISDALYREPLAHVPFRHQYSDGVSVLQLAQSGRAILSLVTYEELPVERRKTPESVCFSGGERYECYLVGSARGEIFEIVKEEDGVAVLDRQSVTFREGGTLSLSGGRKTKTVTSVNGRLVMLRLGRTPMTPDPAKEYRISDGKLVHRASGLRKESHQELAMALLGKMARSDAGDVFERIAFSGSEHLRWQAVREFLALDTARGFTTLCKIASNPNDSLSQIAGTLRARLIEAHPQLANI